VASCLRLLRTGVHDQTDPEPQARALPSSVRPRRHHSDEIQRVIQPYQRAETLRRAVPGHGLGLFIAQRIVEEHSGTMSIDSTPGKGSVIRVVIPAEPRDASVEHAVH